MSETLHVPDSSTPSDLNRISAQLFGEEILVKRVDLSCNENWVAEILLLLAYDTKESPVGGEKQKAGDKDEVNKSKEILLPSNGENEDKMPLRWS